MIIRSPYDDVELTEAPLAAYVLDRAEEQGAKAAIIDGATGRVLSYADLAVAVRRTAAGLVARGVAKGDVVALCSPNCPEFVVAYYAVLAAGGVVTTANPLAPAREIASQLVRSGARWLITTEALFGGGARQAVASAGVRESFVFGKATGATPFAALAGSARRAPPPAVTPDDLAILLFSSGTTGLPKGVMLSHRSLVASLCQTRAVHRVRAGDTLLAVLPLFHIFALQVTLSLGLANGATVVTMPRFDLAELLRLVQEYGVTRFEAVPPVVLALAKQPCVDDFDLSSLRLITSGAAPLGAGLASECAGRLGCRVKQGYGMTEFGGATHLVPDAGGGDLESIGPALPGNECRVVDCASGLDVGIAQPGELLVRSPGTMLGYLAHPEATAAIIDADGWLHTGDVVVADREGWFTVIDRVKELIKYKGSQVAPAGLEAILLAHDAVSDAAVVPSPDEEAGEIPKAFVVLREAATADELMSFVADRVAPHEKIRRLEFVADIPRSPSGKILRRLLIARERERAGREEASLMAGGSR